MRLSRKLELKRVLNDALDRQIPLADSRAAGAGSGIERARAARSSCAAVYQQIRFCRMSHTITIRLNKELAEWLAKTAKRMGVPQGKVVRDQLEKARSSVGSRPYMRLAGCIRGLPRDLSRRKGFSRA